MAAKLFVRRKGAEISPPPDATVVEVDDSFRSFTLPSGTFGEVLSVGPNHSHELLVELLRVMTPEGTLTLRQPVVKKEGMADDVARAVLFAGFMDGAMGTVDDAGGEVVLLEYHARKPAWEVGTAQALPGRGGISVANVWTVAVDEEDVDLVNEDSLLDEQDREKPRLAPRAPCAPTKKPCKNCTCGRADVDTGAITSSCGSCYLGDAYRCSSCPYKGLPPFVPGEKPDIVRIDTSTLDV